MGDRKECPFQRTPSNQGSYTFKCSPSCSLWMSRDNFEGCSFEYIAISLGAMTYATASSNPAQPHS